MAGGRLVVQMAVVTEAVPMAAAMAAMAAVATAAAAWVVAGRAAVREVG